MCKICTDWENGKISSKDALAAAGRISETSKAHLADIVDKIMAKEAPQSEKDEGLESDWWKLNHPED